MLSRVRNAVAFGALAVATLGTERGASADPQATVDLTIGVAGVGKDRVIWDDTDFHLGLRGDVLFGRTSPRSFGIGPYAEVLTHSFGEIQLGGGASVLLPIIEYLPIVASFGAYARRGDDRFGFEPGVAAELFWGSRSYNYHSTYVLSAGLLAEMRYGLGKSKETSIVIGTQLDLIAISLPFVFLYEALKGGSHDTDPVGVAGGARSARR